VETAPNLAIGEDRKTNLPDGAALSANDAAAWRHTGIAAIHVSPGLQTFYDENSLALNFLNRRYQEQYALAE